MLKYPGHMGVWGRQPFFQLLLHRSSVNQGPQETPLLAPALLLDPPDVAIVTLVISCPEPFDDSLPDSFVIT